MKAKLSSDFMKTIPDTMSMLSQHFLWYHYRPLPSGHCCTGHCRACMWGSTLHGELCLLSKHPFLDKDLQLNAILHIQMWHDTVWLFRNVRISQSSGMDFLNWLIWIPSCLFEDPFDSLYYLIFTQLPTFSPKPTKHISLDAGFFFQGFNPSLNCSCLSGSYLSGNSVNLHLYASSLFSAPSTYAFLVGADEIYLKQPKI